MTPRARIRNPLQDSSVLILEDEVFIAMALSQTVIDSGASSAIEAHSIEDARNLMPDNDFSVALLDVRLRDGLSYDLGADLIEQGVTVVFHSGHAQGNDVQNMPGSVFCDKPAAPAEIVSSILKAKQCKQRRKPVTH